MHPAGEFALPHAAGLTHRRAFAAELRSRRRHSAAKCVRFAVSRPPAGVASPRPPAWALFFGRNPEPVWHLPRGPRLTIEPGCALRLNPDLSAIILHDRWQSPGMSTVQKCPAEHLMQQHREIDRRAQRESSNLAQAAAEGIRQTIASVDDALRFMRAIYMADPKHFDIKLGRIALIRHVRLLGVRADRPRRRTGGRQLGACRHGD